MVMQHTSHPIMSLMVVDTPIGNITTDAINVRFPMVFPVGKDTFNRTYVEEKTGKTMEFSLFHSEELGASGVRIVEPTCFEKIVRMLTDAKETNTVAVGAQEVSVVAEIRNRD